MAKKRQRLPKYGRVKNPPNMELQERDKRIMEGIQAFDGIMGFSQIRRYAKMGKSQAEHRMMLMYQNRYVDRPGRKRRMKLPEMVYWLDKRGAQLVAGLYGVPLSQIGWRKKPRWGQIEHDLAVNDFRLDLMEACGVEESIELQTWIPESEFWKYPDIVEYKYGRREMKRGIRPDGYFELIIPKHLIRYLLEIDLGTEDNPRFLREKILPGLAYLKTRAYEERFGHRSGRWIVVTTGDRRMRNMMRQARRAKAKGLFYFTTFDKLRAETILRSPIWNRADRDKPVPLIFLD